MRLTGNGPLSGLDRKPRRLCTATPASVRDVNKTILLNLIRVHEPISRAELSRHTGIFRSNISRIVDEMIADGVVDETRGNAGARGRRPMHLELRDESFQVLGVFVQPVQTRIAFAGLSGRIQKTWTLPTPQTPAALVSELAHAVQTIRRELRLSGEFPIRSIGVAVPGLVSHDTGQIVWAPALPKYSGFRLAEELWRQIGIPVFADNDCNLGALSEFRQGAPEKDHPMGDFVFLSIGDLGVGGGLVADGNLYRGHDSSFVAEFGHMIVEPNGPSCLCGRMGCWELYISNKATWERYAPRRPFHVGAFSELLDRAEHGDQKALRALDTTARYVALGASNIALVVNPSAIVLAGQITKAWNLIEKTLTQRYSSAPLRVAVRPARLAAEDSLLHGAVWLALSSAYKMPQFGPHRNLAPAGEFIPLHS